MNRFSFKIPVTPQSMQGEDRSGRTRTGKHVRYSTERKKSYLEEIRLLSMIHRPPVPISCAVQMDAVCVFARPKTGPGRFRKYVWGTPDEDNLKKPIKDALTMAGFWTNDSLVVIGRCEKRYANDGERPHIEITIEGVE